VNNKYIVDKTRLEEEAANFRAKLIKEFPNYDSDLVMNSDQTEFNYEIASKRTLSHTGEKDTIGTVQNKNATTHSFTVQPTITMSGKCYEKLLLCLRESSNEFGPIVKKQIEEVLKFCKNIRVVCSRSGKMNSYLVNDRAKNLFNSPNSGIQSKVLLLLDFYTCHWNKEFDSSINSKVKRRKIPGGTTSFAQPLDKRFTEGNS
jgi:hypothetical protein